MINDFDFDSVPLTTAVDMFLELVANLKIKAKKYCKNKKIPLENRWAVFEKIGKYFGERECCIIHLKSLPEEFIMYDGDYMHSERHQEIDIDHILEHIKDGIEDEVEDGELNGKYSKIDLDKFKEEVLQKFLWSFCYDW